MPLLPEAKRKKYRNVHLVNAIVHRDYTHFGRDIKIGIYDDIVNIVSPGGLPNTLTIADLDKGRSEIRNKTIARVFKELGYIEQWGSGIQRMKGLCIQSGLKEPLVEETGDFINVEFFRSNEAVAEDNTSASDILGKTDALGEKLDKNEERSYNEIVQNANITAKELAKLLEISTTAVDNIRKLKEKNLIRRIGSDRGGHWKGIG